MIEVVEINDLEDLPQYRLLWNSLFAATPNATFFLTPDWLETYWHHFGDAHKLRVLIVYAAGEPLGILPLCVRREKHRLGAVRVLTFPLDNWGTWYGPIGPNPAATLLAAVQHIRRTPRDWDMIELRWVADEATQGGKTARALRIGGLLSEKRIDQTTSLVDLPTSWAEFTAAKSPALRTHYSRTLYELADDGRTRYVRHRPAPAAQGDGEPLWDVYHKCESLAQQRFPAGEARGDSLDHDQVRDFARDAHAAAARLGMVDINLLLVDDRPAAFLYGYHCHGHVSALRTGFDPAHDDLEFAVLLKSIEDSCQRGDRSFDFGPGERQHKRHLRTRTEPTFRLTYTPLDSWRSQAVRWSRWAKDRWARSRAGNAIPQSAV